MFSRCLPFLLAFVAPATAQGAGPVLKVPQDFATIQAAVDAAADGAIIQVSAGDYAETVSVGGASGLVLRGKGKVVLHSGAVAALTLNDCTDCLVEKIRVQGGPAYGIRVQNSSGCTVSKCRVEDVASDGVRIEYSFDIRVDKCTIRDVGWDAISLAAGDDLTADTCILTKNRCFRPGNDGLSVYGSGNLLEDNLVYEAVGDGIDVETPSSSNMFRGNRVIRAGGTGVVIRGAFNEVRDNKIVQSSGSAVYLAAGSNHVVDGNHLVKAGQDTIQVAVYVQGPFVLDNKVHKAGDDGIQVDGDGAIIEGNKITGAAADGVRIMGDFGHYASNKANGSGQDGFHLIPSALGNLLTLNKAHKSKGFDLHDESGGSSIADDNDFGLTWP